MSFAAATKRKIDATTPSPLDVVESDRERRKVKSRPTSSALVAEAAAAASAATSTISFLAPAPSFTPRFKQITKDSAASCRVQDQSAATLTCVSRSLKEYNGLLKKNIMGIIADLSSQQRAPIKILDSGCGKARVVKQLLEHPDLERYISEIIGISRDYYASVESVLTGFPARFKFYLGQAQDVLESEDIHVNLILDVWGTASYAHDKLMYILALYYKALEINGRAYIYLGRPEITKMEAHLPIITLRNEKGLEETGEIFEILPKLYPLNFKFVRPQTLFMKKTEEAFPIPGEFEHVTGGMGHTLTIPGMEDPVVAAKAKIVAPANVVIRQRFKPSLALGS